MNTEQPLGTVLKLRDSDHYEIWLEGCQNKRKINHLCFTDPQNTVVLRKEFLFIV